jgi:hypothetical protein
MHPPPTPPLCHAAACGQAAAAATWLPGALPRSMLRPAAPHAPTGPSKTQILTERCPHVAGRGRFTTAAYQTDGVQVERAPARSGERQVCDSGDLPLFPFPSLPCNLQNGCAAGFHAAPRLRRQSAGGGYRATKRGQRRRTNLSRCDSSAYSWPELAVPAQRRQRPPAYPHVHGIMRVPASPCRLQAAFRVPVAPAPVLQRCSSAPGC